ncbi:c-type cytochrome [Pseudooceanicola sp.]|jgi:mono/diheme cytochrome c family protein|uniref:c-type cytochrome n=1 Tax=Pseudooceanicola sp. TaxID=1914328 RepID=UPI004059A851
MGRTLTGFALGIILTLLVGVAVWLTIAYSGAYNVAATERHADTVRWTLDKTMHSSISSRANAVALPEDFTEEQVAEGASAYAEYCAHCHGAPGQDPAEWSRGMRPEPPLLVEAASEWSAAEIHWIIDNGLKMTGMPAFGPHHEAEEIMALTAFVSALPGLTSEDFEGMTAGEGGHTHGQDRDGEDGASASASEAAETGNASAPAAEAVDPEDDDADATSADD